MSISLSCIDTIHYDSSLHALKRTIETLGEKVNVVYWYSDLSIGDNILGVPVNHIKTEKFTHIEEYCRIALKVIPEVCVEDYDIIIHWDGYATNPEAWTDDFYNYDYIGATWDDGVVGNGGFCWRSKKLYKAFKKVDIKYRYDQYPSELVDRPMYINDYGHGKFIPDDVVVCRLYKEEFENNFDIKYAPTDVADRFSIENHSYISPWTGQPNPWVGKSLGFHGKFGIRQLYS